MTIDEAIKFISNRQILGCFLTCEECSNYGCDISKIICMLEEFKWYKEQDLILRSEAWGNRPEWLNEDMYDINKSKENKGWNKCNNYWCEIIKNIPKAEYGGNGDDD